MTCTPLLDNFNAKILLNWLVTQNSLLFISDLPTKPIHLGKPVHPLYNNFAIKTLMGNRFKYRPFI